MCSKNYGISFLASVVLAIVGTAAAEDHTNTLNTLPPPATQKGVTFAKDAGPLFQKFCVRCHGAEEAKAGLRLDTLEAAMKPGHHGAVVVPGDSAKSRLIGIVTRVGKNGTRSHPPHHPLTDEQIGLLRAWIDQGAK
jgi:hypothetical protein